MSTERSANSNIFEFLRAREIGAMSGAEAERNYCQMKLSQKQLINEYSLNSHVPANIQKVNYIRGTPSYILGIWSANGCMVVTHQPLVVDRGLLRQKLTSRYLTDMCEGPDGNITYTFGGRESATNGIGVFRLQSADFPFSSRSILKKILYVKLYCCASTTNSPRLAFGMNRNVVFIDALSSEIQRFRVFNDSRVHTISFDHSSNLMVTGVSSGHVSIWDVRQKQVVENLGISRYCINESYFLEPDQVIVAGPKNVLCRIDLRMNRVVREYSGHIMTMRKSALSVANNMLCAAGDDNVLRIWHLSGGSPIHEINPYISPDNNVKGWLFSEADKTYLYHFEGSLRKTFQIP